MTAKVLIIVAADACGTRREGSKRRIAGNSRQESPGDTFVYHQDSRSVSPPIRASVEVAPNTFPVRMPRFATPSPNASAVVFEALGTLHIPREERETETLVRDKDEGFDYAPVWSPDGNPLEDIRHSDRITRVMLNGRLYDAATLTEEITGEAELAPLYWQERPAAQIR